VSKGLPVDYVTQYIYQYVGKVKAKRNGVLNGCCPVCMEGSSWGKKARFYYNPSKEDEGSTMSCFNCGYNSNSAGFIMKMTGMTYGEVMEESKDYDIIPKTICNNHFVKLEQKIEKLESPLPDNCINLFDKTQVDYYSDNEVVKLALDYIKTRKLDIAPNRPKTFYLSLDDYIHRNRLIIPYYDCGKIVWYQSRRLVDDDSQKYLSKVDSERSLFNFDNIIEDIPYIFIFEGAIDSMFVKNGTCLSGITESGDFFLTNKQKSQLSMYPMHQRIWILDSPYLDETAKQKTVSLYNMGEKVFQWPKSVGSVCKDFNDIIMISSKKEIPKDFILGNLMKERPDFFKLNSENLNNQLRNLFKSR